MREARRQRAERGEPVGPLEDSLGAAELTREARVLERDGRPGRDRREELEVLAREDPEVLLLPEADEAVQPVLHAERDPDLPPAVVEEPGRRGIRALELAREDRLREPLEGADDVFGQRLGAGRRRVGEHHTAATVVGNEDLAAVDVEDLGE